MGIPVAAAIVVGLVSSFVQSLGLTIQRKSHVNEDLLPLESRRRPIRRPLWLLGFAIYITFNIFSTVFQLDALPIVILAPLGAVSLIFNALFAKLMLGDTFGPSSIIGTGLVTVGAVLIAVFGVVQESEHSLDDLMRLWGRPPFLVFFSIVAAATLIVLISAHVTVWNAQRGSIKLEDDRTPPDTPTPSNYASPHDPPPIPFRAVPMNRRWSSPATTPSRLAVSTDHKTPTKAVRFLPAPVQEDLKDNQRNLTLAGLAFAAASGTLSGMSLVLAKAAVELLVITIQFYHTGHGENQFKRVQSWLLVLGLGIGAIAQLVYLNYSLTFASPALICPLAFCFFNLSSIFDGLVFYDQFGQLKPYQIALVSIGVAILLLGVWVVSLIQPEGRGVDVGTWVEDEENDQQQSAEATTMMSEEPEEAILSPDPESPGPLPRPYRHPRLSDSPQSPASTSSPRSPFSPSMSRYRRRPPRYGTLLPEYARQGAPTGFSIGLGAASPGFVLRSSSLSGNARRGRTRSEGQAGIQDIIRGAEAEMSEAENQEESALRGWTSAPHARRQSWWREVLSRRRGKGPIHLPDDRG